MRMIKRKMKEKKDREKIISELDKDNISNILSDNNTESTNTNVSANNNIESTNTKKCIQSQESPLHSNNAYKLKNNTPISYLIGNNYYSEIN